MPLITFATQMSITRHVPNAITCLNLLCGCLAAILAVSGDVAVAALLVVLGAVFDFFDGFAARLLKVSSPIGKQLDSLADMVTFGLVPGLILLHYLRETIGADVFSLEMFIQYPQLVLPLAVPVFSALRLAKFNVDERQAMGFRGLPTPASALWCVSIPLILFYAPSYLPDMEMLLRSPVFLIGSSLGLSVLMVSDVPLMAMKFKHFGWQGNGLRYGFLISALLLLIILHTVALPVILLLYVIVSFAENRTQPTP